MPGTREVHEVLKSFDFPSTLPSVLRKSATVLAVGLIVACNGGSPTDGATPPTSANPPAASPGDTTPAPNPGGSPSPSPAPSPSPSPSPSPVPPTSEGTPLDMPAGMQTQLVADSNGSGSACTLAQPCSLTQARDRVRTMNSSMTGDIVVSLKAGMYQLGSTFALTAQDSGKNGHDVHYQAYSTTSPVLSGGVRITNWSVDPANSQIYRAPVPGGFQETRQLYVNGKPAARTRVLYPGYTRIGSGFSGAGATAMASWRNVSKIEVAQTQEWRHFRCPVGSISGTTINVAQPCWNYAQIGIAGLTMTSLGTQQNYPFLISWIENAYELFSGPGQWYHDVAGGYIYYWPRAGESMTGSNAVEVMAPQLETLMRVTGTPDAPVQHIHFRGLTFAHATWRRPATTSGYVTTQAGYMLGPNTSEGGAIATPGNVVFDYAQSMVLLRNTFQGFGATALAFDHGAKFNQVHGNRFTDISGSAVRLADVDGNTSDDRIRSRSNFIVNNYIARVGRDLPDQPGITVMYASDTTVDHNEIYDLPYSGISLGWGWTSGGTVLANNKLTNNRIHNTMQQARDGGMIYTLSNQPGSVISGNHLMSQPLNYGAIYLDQGSANFTINNNVIGSSPNWLVLHGSDSNVQTNYVDVFGNLLWPASSGKPFTRNASAGAWPAAALNVINAAGIDASMQDMREKQIRIEAETFNHGGQGVGYSDVTGANEGSAYRRELASPEYNGPLRNEGVDIYPCATCSNLQTVGSVASGEWLGYSVYANKTGSYDFEFAVSSTAAGGQVQLRVDGQPVGSPTTVPNTGNWNAYQLATLTGISLAKGPHIITLAFTGSFNFDYFTMTEK